MSLLDAKLQVSEVEPAGYGSGPKVQSLATLLWGLSKQAQQADFTLGPQHLAGSTIFFCNFYAQTARNSQKFLYLCNRKVSNITMMTTIELRTSIAAELDQMSVEMLESVSRYVSRLRHRARSSRRGSSVQDKREAAMLFVKNLSVQGGTPVPSDESGIDALVDEKYVK